MASAMRMQEAMAELAEREEVRKMHARKDGIGLLRKQRDLEEKEAVSAMEDELHALRLASEAAKAEHSDDIDSDEEFLRDDPMLAEIRAKRMKSLQRNLAKRKAGHGEYREIEESQFLPEVTGTKTTLVHFYHRDFERCKIVDKHLSILSHIHFEAKFLKLNVEKAPFFVNKLQVRVLPAVILFDDGVVVDRVVGFGELGNRDDFSTREYEAVIAATGLDGFEVSEQGTFPEDFIVADEDEDEEEKGDRVTRGLRFA